MSATNSIAIIGAGLCGLTIANQLKNDLTYLIEKSKSVGGRMASRRDGKLTFDHGAQFYRIDAAENFLWHSRWLNKNLTSLWFEKEHKSYFCGRTGMTTLAKDLALDQKIFFDEKVLQVKVTETSVEIYCESGKQFKADIVVMTAPTPQSLEILRRSKIDYPAHLNQITYAKSLVGLFHVEVENKNSFPEFKYVNPGTSIFSIADNQTKGISDAAAWTVVMDSKWSEQHFDQSDQLTIEGIQNEFNQYCHGKIKIKSAQLKKWKFSHPLATSEVNFCALQNGKIILAGDGFTVGSLRGAVASGEAVANYLLKDLP